jgi:imidazolonepropionase-like amidohydrolase
VPLAIQTGRGLTTMTLIEEVRVARRLGLSRANAIKAVTSTPARILGLEKRIGTLTRGKDADLVIWERDPLGATGKVRCVIVKGRPVSGRLPAPKGGSL